MGEKGVGTRTYVWVPAGFSNAHDIVQKEAGAVLHADALAPEEGLDGGVCPEGMDVGGEGVEEGGGVGGMVARAAGGLFGGGGDGVGSGDARQDVLPGATGADTDLAVAKEKAIRVVAGPGGPLGPAMGGGEGGGCAAELGEELAGEVGLDAEEGEEAEAEGRVGLGQGGVVECGGGGVELVVDDGEQPLDGAVGG